MNLRKAAEQALDILEDLEAGQQYVIDAITALRQALEAEQQVEPAEHPLSGLPMVIAGAIFDFAGFLTTRSKVIEVGSTANAAPVADLVKEWAELRGLSIDDAAVLSWQEPLYTRPQPRQPLTDEAELQCPYPQANPSTREAWLDGWEAAERAHGIGGEA